jgi:hypothetical protein
VQTLTPTLTWVAYTPPALNYKARISQSSSTDLNGMLDHASAVSSGWIGTTSIGVGAIPFALSAGSTYYWQVKSQLADAPHTESDWSHVVSFQTAANLSVIVPFVVSPIKNQPINNTTAILSWALPIEPKTHLKYDLEYSKSADFRNADKLSEINEPFAKIEGLDQNSKYYWRVVSKNADGEQSNYSEVESFSTGKLTDIASEQQVIPLNFSLEQNYPNPFNPLTTISFSIPKDNFVTIKIYDMLGREVITLVNDYRSAGTHTLSWYGEDSAGQKLASGTYIYRITTAGFVTAKKMVLLM